MKSSRTERRRKLRALALVVFSALTARLLLETVPTHAVAAHTFRSLQVVAGALIASIDVLTRRRCVSCCEEVVALLRQHAVEEKNVARATSSDHGADFAQDAAVSHEARVACAGRRVNDIQPHSA